MHPSSHNVPLIISDHCHMHAEGAATRFIISPKTQTQTDKGWRKKCGQGLLCQKKTSYCRIRTDNTVASDAECCGSRCPKKRKVPNSSGAKRTSANTFGEYAEAIWIERKKENKKSEPTTFVKIHPHLPPPISPTHMKSLLNISP